MSREYIIAIAVDPAWDSLHEEDVQEMLRTNIEGSGIHVKSLDPVANGQPSDTGKLNAIFALYEGYFNTDQDIEVFAKEFYNLVGEVFSGRSLKQLSAKYLILDELALKST